ncbi:hypothetical protein [Arthrobacter sp. HY1533]|uniref:hypothetical protein n=1 Tax=Arthrobacter sp. HY1533 TaxID=2970919 RepID=UPI0022B9EF2F|nr:hypothetical protein [Arthrobacter sp. HY1533]
MVAPTALDGLGLELYDEISSIITKPKIVMRIALESGLREGLFPDEVEADILWDEVITAAVKYGFVPELVERIRKAISGRADTDELEKVLEKVTAVVGTPIEKTIVEDIKAIAIAIPTLLGQTDPLAAFGITSNLRRSILNLYEFLDDPAASSSAVLGLEGETELLREGLVTRCFAVVAALDKLRSVRSSEQSSPRLSDDRRDAQRHDESYRASLIDAKMGLIHVLRSLRTEMRNVLTISGAELGPNDS